MIQNNTAHDGAGIFAGSAWEGDACLTLKSCTIRNNHANIYGGGLAIAYHASVNFSQTHLNNIYLNSAGVGSDISRGGLDSLPIQVYLNKATVIEPDNFFFRDNVGSTFTCQQAVFEPVNCDLFVSPDGSNDNSGLTINEPLKTISFAMKKIKSDSLYTNTIYLAEGTYSKSQTGEEFPINLRSFVTIEGSDMYETILDGDSDTNVFLGRDNERDFIISNLSIVNCYDDYTHGYQAPIY